MISLRSYRAAIPLVPELSTTAGGAALAHPAASTQAACRPPLNLRQTAKAAVAGLLDERLYQKAGCERIYARPAESGSAALPPGGPDSVFLSGQPAPPVETSLALLDWREFFARPDDAHRPASLATGLARGIATDFAVLASAPGQFGSGAFWESLTLRSNRASTVCSDLDGCPTISLRATADIADALFRYHVRTGDTLCLNAALRASQWLLLKRNADGAYDADRFSAADGSPIIDAGDKRKATLAAAGALIQAFRATGVEVYIRAASQAQAHSFRQARRGACDLDSLSRLTRNYALLYAESATTRTRAELEHAGRLLADACAPPISNDAEPAALRDLLSAAEAMLHLLAIFGEPCWLHSALAARRKAVSAGIRPNARAVALYVDALLALVALVPGCRPDLLDRHVRVGWTTYAADPSADAVIEVRPEGRENAGSVDYLPLVSKIGRSVLVPVLSASPVEAVVIHSAKQKPNLLDLVTGETICQPALLHELPAGAGALRWGCFVIES